MSKFFLRTSQNTGAANLSIRINRPKLKISWWINTGIKVSVREWNKAQKSPRALSQYYSTEEGRKTQELTEKVEKVVDDFFAKRRTITDNDKAELVSSIEDVVMYDAIKAVEEANAYKRELKESKLCVITEYYDYFISGIKSGSIRQKRGDKTYREGSIHAWVDFGKYLKAFCPDGMTFEQINKMFADGFVAYLENLGLMPKTINKHILCFRRLCRAASLDEKNKNLISVSVWGERVVKEKEKRAEIALSDEEIDALYSVRLEGVREQVRDVWMLGFLSAQRVSDYAHFTRDNFKVTPSGYDVIVLQQTKTGNDVVVPILDDRVKELCAKYDYSFPKLGTATINLYIKEILKGVAKTVPSLMTLYRTRLSVAERRKERLYLDMKERVRSGEILHGDERKRFKEMQEYAEEHGSGELLWQRDYSGEVVKRKYELVSSHTSRRSAITSMYNTGLYDVREMMSVSGHTTFSNFEKYIKRGSIEQAERIAEKAKAAAQMRRKRRLA